MTNWGNWTRQKKGGAPQKNWDFTITNPRTTANPHETGNTQKIEKESIPTSHGPIFPSALLHRIVPSTPKNKRSISTEWRRNVPHERKEPYLENQIPAT